MKRASALVLFAAFLLLALAAAGSAATTTGTVRLGHPEAAIDIVSTPYLALSETFKNVVEAQTKGRFKVQVFPNKQLGDNADLITQCQRGAVQVVAGQNASIIAAIFPEVGILELPYAFSNTYIARTVLNGPYGQDLSERMAAETGVRVLAWLPSALRSFGNNVREITSPEDMKGMKIRVMEAPMMIEMVKALGAQPTPIAYAELYTALQTGVVDGHEQPPYLLPSAKFDEVTKFYSLDNHVLNVMALSINEKFFQSLTPEDRKIFRLAANQAQLAFLGVIQAAEPLDFERMAKKVKVTALNDEQIAKFKELAQPPTMKLFEDKLGREKVDMFLEAIREAEEQASAF